MSVNFPQMMMKISIFRRRRRHCALWACVLLPKIIIIIMYEKHLNNEIKIE